jgi:dGTPase
MACGNGRNAMIDTPAITGLRWRAVYASDPARTRGRLVPEPASPTRSDFQRDRDRIIHSTAFRRLKHKTQVFIAHEGDHYRTRLTHTIEVAQIARSIARALGLDEDLAEALALAHDLGHTPFGHAGERALDRAMAGHGGFDHNAQSLRIVTRLERRYAGFDGLNLTWETLEGLVKHNGPLLGPGRPAPAPFILAYNALHDLDLAGHAGPEAQAAAIADDIAYNAHDIDDGLRARLFRLEDLAVVPFLAELLAEIDGRHPGLEDQRRTHELQRRVITRLVEATIREGRRRLDPPPAGAKAVRALPGPAVAFPAETATADRDIKRFLFANMYRNPTVMRVMQAAEGIVTDLFGRLIADPALLPEDWRRETARADPAVTVADFIAGMTDLYAIDMHRRLFDATPDLR